MLVETATERLLLDVGPDVQEQLHALDVRSIDAAFLTHSHGDHAGGVPQLGQTAKWDADHLDGVGALEPTPESFDPGYPLYLTETAHEHVEDWETVTVGDCAVTAVPIEHHRPAAQTLGFLVERDGGAVCYAPDMRRFLDGPPDADVDLLVCEGAAVLGQPVHGPQDELLAAIESVDADRIVLVNVNEHIQRAHTAELRAIAGEHGFELGTDFETDTV